jgi:DNA-binding transcriptional ArsR family regulator
MQAASVSYVPGLDATFFALADPTRRAILARLAQGEATVNELVAPFSLSQPAISKHLKVLERAGLISRSRVAQRRPCRIEPRALSEAAGWLEDYRRLWEGNFQRLDALLDQLQSPVAATNNRRTLNEKEKDDKQHDPDHPKRS